MEGQDEINQMNKDQKKRPVAITVICIIGFIGAALVIPMVFSDAAALIGNWYPPYLGLSGIIGFICMIGLWKMQKWAAYTYAGFVALNQVVLLVMGVWNIKALIIPAIVIGIALSHLDKMD